MPWSRRRGAIEARGTHAPAAAPGFGNPDGVAINLGKTKLGVRHSTIHAEKGSVAS